MDSWIESLENVTRHVIRAVQDDRLTLLAASIAFYAVLSIFPLLLLALAIGSWLIGEEFALLILEFAQDVLTPEAEDLLQEALLGEGARSGAGIVGAVFLGWAALKVFRGLDIAFSQVYGGRVPEPTFLGTVVHAITVVVAIGVAFLVMFVVKLGAGWFGLSPMLEFFSPIVLLFALCVLFLPMYVVFPGVEQSPLAVLPGTLFAAAGWTVLAELFGLYAANAGTYALFGVIGGMLLLLMWFYFGSIVLLLGATINSVIAGRYREPPAPLIGSNQLPIGEERSIGPDRDEQHERDE